MRATRIAEGRPPLAPGGDTVGARGSGSARPFAERYQAAIAELEGGSGGPAASAPVTVAAGDTLWSMVRHQLESRSECVSDGQVLAEVRRVSASNRLDDPDLIRPGQQIDLGGGEPGGDDAMVASVGTLSLATPSAAAPGLLDAPDPQPSDDVAPAGGPLAVASLIDGARDRVTSSFGMRADPLCGKRRFHAGIDVAAAAGTPARAAASGVVSFAGEQSGYGHVVVVDHGGGVTTMYAHASALLVREGDRVDTGTELIRVGSSGRATGPHLHFELRKDGVAVDPDQLAHLLDESKRA